MARGEWKANRDVQSASPLTDVIYNWDKGHKFTLVDADDKGNVELYDKISGKTIIIPVNNFHEFMEKSWRD